MYFPAVMGKRVKRYPASVRRPLRAATRIIGVRELHQVAAIVTADPDSRPARSYRREDNALSVRSVLSVELPQRGRVRFYSLSVWVKQVSTPDISAHGNRAISEFVAFGRNSRQQCASFSASRFTEPVATVTSPSWYEFKVNCVELVFQGNKSVSRRQPTTSTRLERPGMAQSSSAFRPEAVKNIARPRSRPRFETRVCEILAAVGERGLTLFKAICVV